MFEAIKDVDDIKALISDYDDVKKVRNAIGDANPFAYLWLVIPNIKTKENKTFRLPISLNERLYNDIVEVEKEIMEQVNILINGNKTTDK